MSKDHVYSLTMKMFGSVAEPAFETRAEQEASWGRTWGCDNDVGRLRLVLMHRPGPEFGIIDRRAPRAPAIIRKVNKGIREKDVVIPSRSGRLGVIWSSRTVN